MLVKKLTVLFLAAVMAVSAAAVFAGCTPDEPTPPPGPVETYEFDFVGEAVEAHRFGRRAAARIKQPQIKVAAFEFGGNKLEGAAPDSHTFVDGKGYKLYFEDVGDQFTYTDYDTATQTFSFRYNLDLGEALGSRRIEFTYADPDFASVYDGEGLGPTPPTFEGSGWGGYLGQFEIAPATIRCYEDGTASFTATAVTAVDPKTGTWEYDADTDTYHLYFPPQSFANSSYIQDGHYATVHGQYDVQYSSTSGQTLNWELTYDPDQQAIVEDRRTIYALYLRATATTGRAEDATETLVSEINAFDLSGFIDDIQARGGREADTYIQIHYINQINPMDSAQFAWGVTDPLSIN